ncbi:hypothetical protein FALBO_9325 [Fusarium albosuccineum]|uniref:Uncharacterized protein n=1 Tax=Fusarium albosuccineum TaxID=1237068 RepID=A0A8H4PAS1_9HYPO|nr:hypothetical protein FALBO_9325 [Fusarium albosuccineum]
MTTAEANNLNILDLPVDVLSLILQPLVTSPSPIQLCPCIASPIDPLPVLLSHPALHTIATPLLYAGNEFVLDATGPHAQHVRRELLVTPGTDERLPGRATLLTTPDALRRIARLQVRIDRLRGWVGAGVVPLLAELAVKGRLEHLTVWVRTPGERKVQVQPARSKRDGEGTDLDMFSRPPLEGLLRVLADPYLLSARLWVDARHARTWCRFHAGGCSAGTAGEGWTGSGTREREREREGEVVEIDWREVLRVVDPERKDIAVAVATEKKW